MHIVQLASDKATFPSISFSTKAVAEAWLATHGFEKMSDKEWIKRSGCRFRLGELSISLPRAHATVWPVYDHADIDFKHHPQPVLAYSR